MSPSDLPSDSTELAALYAAGALTPEEMAQFEALLDSDESCRQELLSLHPILTSLYHSYPEIPPPPTIRETLLGRISQDPPVVPSGVYVQTAREGLWENFLAPGIQRRILFSDRNRGRMSMLLRLAPGAEIPIHDHSELEECVILEGEATTFGIAMQAGDYFRAEPGTRHGVTRTTQGCVLLLQTAIPTAGAIE